MAAYTKDNGSLLNKLRLRRGLLASLALDRPATVLETHGGFGVLYRRVYESEGAGVVIERDTHKTPLLARQRPSWAVFEGEAEKVLGAGLVSGVAFDLVDVDPYGDPWPTLEAFFGTERVRPVRVGVAVTDGSRQTINRGQVWHTGGSAAMRDFRSSAGNSAGEKAYTAAVQGIFARVAALGGYRVEAWASYPSGVSMVLSSAVLVAD